MTVVKYNWSSAVPTAIELILPSNKFGFWISSCPIYSCIILYGYMSL